MDKHRILEMLSAPLMSSITLNQLDIVLWGQGLHFYAYATPPSAETIRFELRFGDCREMRWQVYTHMQHPASPAFPPTELVNFRLGRDQHRSPAHLLSEHFGLSLFYGTLHIIHNEKIISLQ